MKNLMVFNDEVYYCYREKFGKEEESDLKGDDKKEVDSNCEVVCFWVLGFEIIVKKLGVNWVVDLLVILFFLSGFGYVEGILFFWIMSDFLLMDVIECGIVKLLCVFVVDNISGVDVFVFCELWKYIGLEMFKKGWGKG